MLLRMPLSISATKAGKDWQRQLALAREGRGVIGMGRVQEKFGRAQVRSKIGKKREKGAC